MKLMWVKVDALCIVLCCLCVGTRLIPCDFLAPVNTHNPVENGKHHEVGSQMQFCSGRRSLIFCHPINVTFLSESNTFYLLSILQIAMLKMVQMSFFQLLEFMREVPQITGKRTYSL